MGGRPEVLSSGAGSFYYVLNRIIVSVLSRKSRASFSGVPQLAVWLWGVWKGYRMQAFLNMLIGCLTVLSDLAFVWATKMSIDIATGVNTSMSLHTPISLLVSIIVLQILLGIASRWVKAMLGVKAQNNMRQKLLGRLLACRWKRLRSFHTGNLLNRMERDVTDVITFLTESIPALANTFLKFIGSFVFLFLMDRTLACVIVLIIPFFIVCSRLYVRKMRRLTHEIRETESRVQTTIQEGLQHTLVIKTLEQAGNMVGRLKKLQAQLHSMVIGKTKYATVSSVIMNAGFAAGYLVAFIWGVTNLEQGLITYGMLIAFVQLVGQIQEPVRTFSKFVPVFITAFTASERLMELERIPCEEQNEPQRFCTRSIGIRFSDVSFSYARDSRLIFDNFSYDFPPGSITAILGETGSGKTTLIRMMLALLTPASGDIGLYASEEETTYRVSPATRCNFSYVPQGNTLLSGTILENLQMGNPQASREEMKQALQMAGADFVESLPKGIDTVCGEMGEGLSEGQAQRIAIARALLRPAPVLLLDEATSSLDAATEQTVIRNIVSMNTGRTLIFITHRPEVLKYATQKLYV